MHIIMKPNLALFDFDGTITRKDTMFEFIIFVRGRFTFCGLMFLVLPWLLGLKLGLSSAQRVKEKLLRLAIGNLTVQKFAKLCDDFCASQLPSLIRPEAMRAIETHLQQGNKVAIVSASPENWIQPWAKLKDLEVISTRLMIVDNHITGIINGLNCNGAEKVVRVKNDLNLSSFDKIYAYGDSKGDREMLALADFPFYRKFE